MLTGTCPKCGAHLTVESSDEGIVTCAHCGTRIRININVNYNYSKSEHTEHIVDEAKIKNAENADRVINIFATPFEQHYAKKERERIEEEEKKARKKEKKRLKKEQERLEEQQEALRQAEQAAQRKARNEKIFSYCKTNAKQLAIGAVLCVAIIGGGTAIAVHSHNESVKTAAHQAELAQLEAERVANSHLAMGQAAIPEDLDEQGDYRNAVKKLKDAGFTNITTEEVPDMVIGYATRENYIKEMTVDGAPEFEKGVWISVDTPIVIRYHVYREGAKEAKDEILDNATDTITNKVNDAVDRVGEKIDSLFS